MQLYSEISNGSRVEAVPNLHLGFTGFTDVSQDDGLA